MPMAAGAGGNAPARGRLALLLLRDRAMLPYLRASGAIQRASLALQFRSQVQIRCDRLHDSVRPSNFGKTSKPSKPSQPGLRLLAARAVRAGRPAQRFFSGSGGGGQHRSDDDSGDGTLDPDAFLAGLVERVQLSRGGSRGGASFAATWGDGYRDDLDTDWLEATSREGMDPVGERVLAVLPFSSYTEHGAMEWPAKMEEALALCGSLGSWDVVDALALRERRASGQQWGKGPNRGLYLRPGQVKMVAQAVQQTGCDAVFVDALLTPLQARNLSAHLGVEKLYDRFGLILSIFDANATTREAKVQVEIAVVRYEMTRLVRGGARNTFGDGRQVVSGRGRGGGKMMAGSGEMQIEVERRLLKTRVNKLGKELQKIARHRKLQRDGRRRSGNPIVALVGYTNAGKSALLNALTGASINSQDRLFCTLDPTMRSTRLPNLETDAVVVDTVGFISDLPTALVAAFHSTLEEILYADVLLHVRDVSSANFTQQKVSVLSVLREIGVEEEMLRHRTVEVWNKTDLLCQSELLEVMHDEARCPYAAATAVPPHAVVPISVTTGHGLDRLIATVEQVYGGLAKASLTPPAELTASR